MQPLPRLTLALCLALVPACQLDLKELTAAGIDNPPPESTSDPSGGTGGTGDASTGDTSDTTDATTDPTGGDVGPGARDVDILFVVDNSGSMAPVQQSLASGIGGMVAALDAAGIDYRIAVTTTDSGNPRCPQALNTPEAGSFVMSSCRERVAQGEFAFNTEDFSAACLAACPHETLATTPTLTPNSPEPYARPWLEKIDGVTNTADIPIAEAVACLLPQGVAGCGFEQPLESMYLALSKATQGQAPGNFDFLRDEANLLVVLVTDEVDCSYNPDFQDIFTTNKTFWNDPTDPVPTSAMCWRAGSACSGGPGVYDECHAVDRDATGQITDDPAQAVLRPLERYQTILAQIQEAKSAAGSAGKVYVAAVVGVPVGYQHGDPIPFADAESPDDQADFGIGPGCTANTDPPRAAVPPLRIKEFVDMVPRLGNGLYSICDGGLKNIPSAFGQLLTQ